MSVRRAASLAAVAALAAALVANAVVSFRSVGVLADGFDNETRPAEVQRTLLGLLSALQDAETGQRGYLLTGDRPYLEPYLDARPTADSLLARLDTLVSWNALQVDRMPGLRATTDAKFAELAETIQLYDTEGPAAALDVVRTNRGKASMDDTRVRVAAMLAEAARVREMFAQRAERAERQARRSALVSTGALAALLVLLGLGAWAFGRRREREATRLAEAAEGLAVSNAALSTALGEREAALGRVRAMQAQLVQQEKLAGMGRLTAGVAHEIKNPLNFVTNFAALTMDLADEAASAAADERADLLAAIRQNAAKIVHHGQRADEIVQSMLIHARGVTGEREPADLAALVHAAVAQAVGPEGDDDEVAVEIESGLGPVPVVGPAVTRVVRNLVDNALYAVRERSGSGDPAYVPQVEVDVRRGADHDGRPAAVVTVADNGPGIPDELFPRIFEPFVTTKGPGSGTGLGLSLAHDIAVGHGGSLLAERPAGGGAAFVLTLPLEADDPGDVLG